MRNFSKTISILTKIFLIGLLIQFFLQTFVTYKLGLTGTARNIVRMRKEAIIAILGGITIYHINKRKLRGSLWKKFPIKWFIIIFAVTLLVTAIVSLLINQTSIGIYIMSIKYSMIGFLIFILFFSIHFLLKKEQEDDMIHRYGKLIKRILVFGLIRRGIIRLMPNILSHVGYNQYNYEWAVGISPPAAYYTQYNEWYTRNQFLFERPISFGFFLIAFWPIFFMLYIRKRWWKNALLWGWLFGLIVLSTFSRAARAARFLQTFILIFVQYQKHLRRIFIYGVLPAIIFFGWITYIGRDQIIGREFSNLWHIKNVMFAIEKVKENPIWGLWAGSAWPASHQIETITGEEGSSTDYNPENQFLQIRIEYGIFGFLGWTLLYLYLHRIWYLSYQQTKDPKITKKDRFHWLLVLAFSLGILWLSLEWLVLHSFVDRMIVYPFMALFGISYAIYWKNKE